MNNKMLRLAFVAVAVTAAAACDKKDSNSVTGTTDYTAVALSSTPTSFNLHVHLVPQKIDTSAETGVIDTVVAHDEAVDSIAFSPVAKIEPEDVPIANGVANMTFSSPFAEVNSSSYVQGDTTGTGTLTVTYTDVNHAFAVTTMDLPVTVTLVP
ncbi:MAG TPA: hypothetical protein VGO46_10745 [Gemmatimonadaceae bacterium]|jgi:hypothetical protein|nr:hypothetical protein [Gemmatimonadaceae bacterium]